MSGRRSIRFYVALAVVAIAGGLFAFVYPTSAWWDQRREIREAERRVELLSSEADELERERDRLRSDEVIARLARERFNLVKPGETAWAIIPGPHAPQRPSDDATDPEPGPVR